ncbi:hypothetical protein [Streptomyces sp. NPDC002205]|uniref:hypothetical protein n=1 Tax=Streptomyces sp. NPDC002205 TaxID=3154411 RepID=UPI00333383AD
MRIRPGTRRTAGSVAGLALAGLPAATAAGTALAAAARPGTAEGKAPGRIVPAARRRREDR